MFAKRDSGFLIGGRAGQHFSLLFRSAVIESDEIFLRGLYYQESTGKHKIGTMRGSLEDPETLGVNLAKKLIWEVGKNE